MDSGIQVLHMTGNIHVAIKGQSDDVTESYMSAMARDNVEFERVTGSEISRRYPQYNMGDEYVGYYQKDSGLLDAAMANACHIQLARGYGATVIDQCPVTRLSRAGNGHIQVHTTRGVFECGRVVVTAGGWLNTVLGSIGVHVPVTVTQEQVTYFATPHTKHFTKDRFPMFCVSVPGNDIYAFPIHGNTGTKVGVDAGGHVTTADTRTYDPDPVREKICTDMMTSVCPKFVGPILETKTCLYTMPPDRNFVVDTCAFKGWSDVIVCCGAGHAYKFASILGKVLTDLAVRGQTEYDLSQFKITRDAVRDPSFKPNFHLGSDPKSKL